MSKDGSGTIAFLLILILWALGNSAPAGSMTAKADILTCTQSQASTNVAPASCLARGIEGDFVVTVMPLAGACGIRQSLGKADSVSLTGSRELTYVDKDNWRCEAALGGPSSSLVHSAEMIDGNLTITIVDKEHAILDDPYELSRSDGILGTVRHWSYLAKARFK